MLDDGLKAPAVRFRRAWRGWLFVAVLCSIPAGIGFLKASTVDGDLPPPLLSGGNPPVTLPDGQRSTLAKLLRPGRPTVIHLSASWCWPCRLEAPDVAELRQRLGARANFVSLNVRDHASRDELNRYLVENGLPANSYAQMEEDRIPRLTGAKDVLIPRTIAFSASGVPLARITGYRPLALRRLAEMVQ